MNYFELFHLQPAFKIDVSQLRKLYYQEAKNCQQDPEKLTFVNKAYETLKDAFQRLAYLLKIQGMEASQHNLPQHFLMEMMEWNEQIEEVQNHGNVMELQEKMELEEKKIWHEIELDFENQATLQQIQEKYFFLKYILRAKENLRNIAP